MSLMSNPLCNAIAAVVFDWAGTTVDHGSLAPVRTLQRVFANRDIPLTDDVARRDMGMAKHDHIRNLLAEPEVRAEWQRRYQRLAVESDIDELYQEFIPLQMSCLLDYAQVIDGVIPVVDTLRSRGIRIGGTTGYTRAMLEPSRSPRESRDTGPTSRFVRKMWVLVGRIRSCVTSSQLISRLLRSLHASKSATRSAILRKVATPECGRLVC